MAIDAITPSPSALAVYYGDTMEICIVNRVVHDEELAHNQQIKNIYLNVT